MTAMLPMLPIAMLALSTLVLEISFGGASGRPADRSHLDDPNLHLEELVVWTEVPQGKSVRA
jgi:hypothetical protein